MIGSLLTRGLVMAFGYVYPAYKCFKTLEMNKPEIEKLRFWCQYWILVAGLTVFERIGDIFISWLPMYFEAKLALFIYLWYPKTKGTIYVYDSFLRPYVAKHETEIDGYLMELRSRARAQAVWYCQQAATYGQTRIFEILHYVVSQTSSKPQPAQVEVNYQLMLTEPSKQESTAIADKAPPSPKSAAHRVEPSKQGQPADSGHQNSTVEEQAAEINTTTTLIVKDGNANSSVPKSVMEEAKYSTRGRLRKTRAPH